MEEIIVLDYYDGSVWIYKLPCPKMNDAAIDDWLDYNNLELKDLDSIDITNLSALDHIPYSRGGYNKYGSCVWNDLEDFQLHIKVIIKYLDTLGGGRTKPLITDKHAMLDCCKPFVLNTETNKIEEWHI